MTMTMTMTSVYHVHAQRLLHLDGVLELEHVYEPLEVLGPCGVPVDAKVVHHERELQVGLGVAEQHGYAFVLRVAVLRQVFDQVLLRPWSPWWNPRGRTDGRQGRDRGLHPR
jgi:hypothetical protein